MSAPAPSPPLALDALDLAPDEVRARLRSARRRGQPAWLWPDVPVEDWRQALRRIEAVARAVLGGAPGPALLEADGEAQVRALGVAAYTSGLGPLLGYWIETGALDTSPSAAALLALHLAHGRLRAARVQAEASRALGHLAAASVQPIVLKGAHTAVAYFPEPGTRPVSDIDLLVDPSELAAAEEALAAAGYEGGRAQHRPYKREWALPGEAHEPRSLELAHAGDRLGIDLHASLGRNFFGVAFVRPGAGALPTRAWALPAHEGGSAPAPARVLAQPALTLFLALHASEGLHNLTLIRLVELALVLRAEVDGDALLEAADAARALRFAYPALTLCERLAPGTVPSRVLDALANAATPAQRRVLASLTPATAQRLERLSLEERFMWAGTPGERIRRLLHGAWPAPAGRSAGELGRIYAERAWRLARGRVVR